MKRRDGVGNRFIEFSHRFDGAVRPIRAWFKDVREGTLEERAHFHQRDRLNRLMDLPQSG